MLRPRENQMPARRSGAAAFQRPVVALRAAGCEENLPVLHMEQLRQRPSAVLQNPPGNRTGPMQRTGISKGLSGQLNHLLPHLRQQGSGCTVIKIDHKIVSSGLNQWPERPSVSDLDASAIVAQSTMYGNRDLQ